MSKLVEGQKCPICNEGTLSLFTGIMSENVFVSKDDNVFECSECGDKVWDND